MLDVPEFDTHPLPSHLRQPNIVRWTSSPARTDGASPKPGAATGRATAETCLMKYPAVSP